MIYNSANTFTVIVLHDIYELPLFHRALNTSYISFGFFVKCLHGSTKLSPTDKENDLKTKPFDNA